MFFILQRLIAFLLNGGNALQTFQVNQQYYHAVITLTNWSPKCFHAAILICHSKKSTGITVNSNNSCAVFKCGSKS